MEDAKGPQRAFVDAHYFRQEVDEDRCALCGRPSEAPMHVRVECPFHDAGLPLSLPPEVHCTCPAEAER